MYTRHKTKMNKPKTPHNMCCTPLCTRRRQKTTAQYVLDTTMDKTKTKNHNTIFVGHHYGQDEDNKPQHNICRASLCTRRRQQPTTQCVLGTTMHKTKTKNHNTIFVGHHYAQEEDKHPQHNICWAPLCTRRRQKTTTQDLLGTSMHKTKAKKNTIQYVLGTTMHKTKTKTHNTICVGHHYAQDEDKKPQHNICWAPFCTRRRHKTTTQCLFGTTLHKTKTTNHNTIFVGHHYAQDEDKKTQHNMCWTPLCTRRRQKTTTQYLLGITIRKQTQIT